MNPDQQAQLQSKPLDIIALPVTASRLPMPVPSRKLASWIEGTPAVIAAFDAGVTEFGLERVYWREHKVGWRRIRVVYELHGPPAKVDAFACATEQWAKQFGA